MIKKIVLFTNKTLLSSTDDCGKRDFLQFTFTIIQLLTIISVFVSVRSRASTKSGKVGFVPTRDRSGIIINLIVKYLLIVKGNS